MILRGQLQGPFVGYNAFHYRVPVAGKLTPTLDLDGNLVVVNFARDPKTATLVDFEIDVSPSLEPGRRYVVVGLLQPNTYTLADREQVLVRLVVVAPDTDMAAQIGLAALKDHILWPRARCSA